MVKRSFLPGQPLSPAIPEVRRGPSRFLQVTSDRSRGSQTPSSDTALVARGSVPQPPPTHKTAPSTWTCSNHAAPQATSAVISPLLAQDCLTRLCLITLRSTLDPILLRTAVRRGAGRTAECHLRRSGRGGGQPLGRVVSGGASGRCPGRRASPWSGRPRCPPYRPLPVVVHHWVSTSVRFLVRSGVQPSGVRPSGVRSPGSVVRDRPVRPSGAAVRRSAVWCPPVRPVASILSGSARRGPWDHAGPAGPARQEWVGFQVACPGAPNGSVDGYGAWTQATLRRSWSTR
jgi:hypothetical protein